MKYLKNVFNEENNTKLVGLLTILVASWLVLYFIPEIFISLFNTILGNFIMLITIILLSSKDYRYGIVAGFIFIILYRFNQLAKEKKEAFVWSRNSKQNFLSIQNSLNPKLIYDVDMIQKNQASQEEVDYFNKNGFWPWSQSVQELYKQAVSNNPYIRTSPKDSLNYAMRIYNQQAILRILSYQTKEGQFLLNGVLVEDPSGNQMEDLPSGFGDFGYKSGLIGHLNKDIIKCTSSSTDSTLERITYTGKGGIFGEQTKNITDISYNDLASLIPGFTFVNGPCNPCGALNEKPDYSCPFQLNVKNKPPFISSVWQYLWGIQDDPLVSQPSFLTENINPKEFPLLSELQTELNKQAKN